jgi:hypothetical protein
MPQSKRSLVLPVSPVPAMVEMMPSGSILRMRLLYPSAKNMAPESCRAMPAGPSSCAPSAGPPSPLKPDVDVPAIFRTNPSGSVLQTILGASITGARFRFTFSESIQLYAAKQTLLPQFIISDALDPGVFRIF